MIYPQKLSSKNGDKLINILLIISIIIAVILVLINKITSPNIPWASIANAGIIYMWITVIYSIRRNTNIAAHVLLQMIAISAFIFYIDQRLNFRGWSIYIGIPIILMVANATMLVLSIVGYKKYIKYALYQLIIVFLSITQIVVVSKGIMPLGILNKIAIGISLFSFVISLSLSYKEFYKIIICKFHI